MIKRYKGASKKRANPHTLPLSGGRISGPVKVERPVPAGMMRNGAGQLVRAPSDFSALKCPACPGSASHRSEEPAHLRKQLGANARSRYVDAWICSDCGVEEAFSGFFWKGAAKKNPATVKLIKPRS